MSGSADDPDTTDRSGASDVGGRRADAAAAVVVVGGGPAGLTAAAALRALGAGRVVVVERERQVGGIPRFTDHLGFGLRDRHRMLSGPAYAAQLAQAARRSGVEIVTSTIATGIGPAEAGLTVSLSGGRPPLAARAVLIATGIRERPRSARLVPGDRPAGVLTTGSLQHLVEAGLPVGGRAVIVGAEHVSYSAIPTLAHAGCATVAMVTDHDRHQTHPALALALARRRRVPLITGAIVTRVVGRRRVEAVELSNGRVIGCDTVVFTGDWVPDHELARSSGIPIDPGTLGPAVDGSMRTATAGVFAAGNVLHGAEAADVCALDGRHAAAEIAAWLSDPLARAASPVEIRCAAPLLWSSPNRVGGSPPPRARVLLRTAVGAKRISVTQDGRELWAGRPGGVAAPNRSCWIPARWWADVNPHGGVVLLSATLR